MNAPAPLPPSLHPSILPVVVAEIRVQRVEVKSRGRSAAHQLRDHLSPRNQTTIRGFNLAPLGSLKSESYRSFDSSNSARLATRPADTAATREVSQSLPFFASPPQRRGQGAKRVRGLRVSPSRRGESGALRRVRFFLRGGACAVIPGV